jgi:hypothetical protein
MRLADISQEILGIDVADIPLLDEDGVGMQPSEPTSPAKTSSSKKHEEQQRLLR